MTKENSCGAGAVISAFLIGAFTGAAVALLLAPAPGHETREFLGEKAREGKTRASETARQTRQALNRQRETISAAIERGREAYREARDKEDDA
jgi:gas vesicle protein